MKLITCENATFAYDNKVVLENINFSVEQGDYLCIVGENGSGKSTLIKGILNLISPREGKICFHDSFSAKEIGYLPQQTPVQRDFPATVYEVVLSGCLCKRGMKPFYSLKEKRIANENMKILNIEELKYKCYRELSGGQQQRVLLARALCATDNVLLLDEPVTGLDPLVTKEFYKIIKKLNKEKNITIIMVSHDIAAAMNNASKILHLNGGVLFYGGIKEYLLSDVSNRFVGGVDHV